MVYQVDERLSGRFDDNWNLYRRSFLNLCVAYEVRLVNLKRLFRMSPAGSALTLFDRHFQIDQDNWQCVDVFFSDTYDSVMKQEEVSDELAARKISIFQRGANSEKDALTNPKPLVLRSDHNDIMKKRFLRTAVCEKEWDLRAERANTKHVSSHQYLNSVFTSIKRMKNIKKT